MTERLKPTVGAECEEDQSIHVWNCDVCPGEPVLGTGFHVGWVEEGKGKGIFYHCSQHPWNLH